MSDQPEPHAWQVLGSRVAFANRWAGIEVDEVLLPNGDRYEYTRLRPAGVGVAVAAFDKDGRMVLEREYRHGVGAVIWQLPGGLVDPGEELAATALRELSEETGYAPADPATANVRYLGRVWDNPGIGPAESHIVAVWDVVPVQARRPEPSEFIAVHLCAPEWLKAAVRDGEIRERTTVAALAYLMLHDLI